MGMFETKIEIECCLGLYFFVYPANYTDGDRLMVSFSHRISQLVRQLVMWEENRKKIYARTPHIPFDREDMWRVCDDDVAGCCCRMMNASDEATGPMLQGGTKGNAAWPETPKQASNMLGGNLTPADRHGSVQVIPLLATGLLKSLPLCLFVSVSISLPLSLSILLLATGSAIVNLAKEF